MNLNKLEDYEDSAVNAVTSVLNLAKSRLGIRQSLMQLTQTRTDLSVPKIVNVPHLKNPIAINGEKFIKEVIEKKWNLTDVLMYCLKYLETTRDETADYYHYEAIFSQPTERHPIPQATATIYFRLIENHLEHPSIRRSLTLKFRLESQNTEHDVSFVKLPHDWILGLIQTKLKLFKKIEAINMF